MHIQCKVFIDQRANRFFRLHRVELDEQEFVLRNWCVLRWFSFKILEIKNRPTNSRLLLACGSPALTRTYRDLSLSSLSVMFHGYGVLLILLHGLDLLENFRLMSTIRKRSYVCCFCGKRKGKRKGKWELICTDFNRMGLQIASLWVYKRSLEHKTNKTGIKRELEADEHIKVSLPIRQASWHSWLEKSKF